MKAIILSAGQGSRLLPLTENRPKCLLDIGTESLLERQIRSLHRVGIREVVVVAGFCAGAVEECVRKLRLGNLATRCVHNPFFNVADNLASCWMARHEMKQEFILLNGDTLFETAVCESLLSSPPAPVTIAIDRKAAYDSDDMKVRLDGSRLLAVGKSLGEVDGESIGMFRFQGDGPRLFATILEQIMRTPNGLNWWHLKAIGVLAERRLVESHNIEGLLWCEVDYPHDLKLARKLFAEPAPLGWPQTDVESAQ